MDECEHSNPPLCELLGFGMTNATSVARNGSQLVVITVTKPPQKSMFDMYSDFKGLGRVQNIKKSPNFANSCEIIFTELHRSCSNSAFDAYQLKCQELRTATDDCDCSHVPWPRPAYRRDEIVRVFAAHQQHPRTSNVSEMLNDDCLRHVFRYLCADDLVSTAGVNRCFRRIIGHMLLERNGDLLGVGHTCKSVKIASLHKLEERLLMFGPLVRSLDHVYRETNELNRNVAVELFVRHCRCIEELDIRGGLEEHAVGAALRACSASVKRLNLWQCAVGANVLGHDCAVEQLLIGDTNIAAGSWTMPKLHTLIFHGIAPTRATFEHILGGNPQAKALQMVKCALSGAMVRHVMPAHVMAVHTLTISDCTYVYESDEAGGYNAWATVRQLRTLQISHNSGVQHPFELPLNHILRELLHGNEALRCIEIPSIALNDELIDTVGAASVSHAELRLSNYSAGTVDRELMHKLVRNMRPGWHRLTLAAPVTIDWLNELLPLVVSSHRSGLAICVRDSNLQLSGAEVKAISAMLQDCPDGAFCVELLKSSAWAGCNAFAHIPWIRLVDK